LSLTKLKIMKSSFFSYFFTITLLIIFIFIQSCNINTENKVANESEYDQKIGVLLVNHGSRSETWRKALLELESNVKESVLGIGEVKGIKTAFMEYTEPSIASRLKEFDKEGFTEIIIVPIFLTVSPHSFEDIPTIIGQKKDLNSMEMLKIEKIERYTPKANTHITPLLDFTNILQKNVLNRVRVLSKNPKEEGLVLIGYGDETYDKEWGELFDGVAEYVKQELGISEHTYGWCGHIAHYNPDKTAEAIESVLEKTEKAIVIPVLVSHDEMFQIKIIGGGVKKIINYRDKVIYRPDAILPDKNIENWVVASVQKEVAVLKKNSQKEK